MIGRDLVAAEQRQDHAVWYEPKTNRTRHPSWHTSLGFPTRGRRELEITAIPELLELIHIRGAVVTIDAMGGQKDIAKKIVDGGADYMLAVKENQPTLHSELIETFRGVKQQTDRRKRPGYFETQDEGLGRQERRRCWTTSVLQGVSQSARWAALGSLVLIEAT